MSDISYCHHTSDIKDHLIETIRTGRKSIYVSASPESALHRLLSMRGDNEVSHTLETAVERYLTVIGYSLPEFTIPEWCMVLDSQLGVWVSDEIGVQLVGETTVETMDMDGLDQKWGVDAHRMREIMTNLSYAEKQSICEFIELYRAHHTGDSYDVIITWVLSLFRSHPSEMKDRPQPRMSPDRLRA